MKKITLITIILNLMFHSCAIAQNAKIDSLKKVLLTLPGDTNRVKTFISIAKKYYFIPDFKNSKSYSDSALILSEKISFKKGEANALTIIASIYHQQGNYPEALKNNLASLKIREEIGDKQGIAACYSNIGSIYFLQGNYPEALKNQLASLKISKEIGNKNWSVVCYIEIGNIYTIQGNYPEALKNYLAALKIKEEIGDKNGIAACYTGIGIIYYDQGNYPEALKNFLASLKLYEEIGDKTEYASCAANIGNIYYDQGNYPEALKIWQASLKIYEETGNKNGIASCYGNIGSVYYEKGAYPEALRNLQTSLKIREEIGDKNGIATCYNSIGNIYTRQGNYPEARKALDSSSRISNDIGANDIVRNSHKSLASLDSATGNWKEAFDHYKLFTIYKDSLINEENTKKTVRLLMQYDFDKREDSIHSETEKKELLAKSQMELLNRENEIQKLKVKDQQSQLTEASLLAVQKENEIVLLNQGKEIQQLELKKQKGEIREKTLLSEAKTKEVQLLNKDNELKQKEIRRQTLVRNGFIGGFALVLVFAGIFFTQRNKIRKGKKRSDELLLNILPEETAEELKTKGNAEAKSFDEVTVMFTDFKDFTKASEKLSPAELVKEIHHCYSEFDKIITRHNLEKIKTIGDSYMCAGGLPVPNKTNAEDTVKAALEICRFMAEEKQKSVAEGKPYFELRIGLNTGPVVAGIVGIKKFAYDIWGDTVNIASRMEQNSVVGKINISGNTYELVKDKFKCEYRGKISAKNKGEIDMYFVGNTT